MEKIDKKLIEKLVQNGCRGEIEKIEISQSALTEDFEIFDCEFIGVNKIFGKVILKNSTFKDSSLLGHCYIANSTVLCSTIGTYTIIDNYTVLKNSTTSSLTVKQNGQKQTYPVLINNAQIDGDVILGGTDMSNTKSRGGSIFAFAHIGAGEFVRSAILGTPPTDEFKNSLVEVGHFGYYGDLTVLSLALIASGKNIVPDDDRFFEFLPQAYLNTYFENKLAGDFEVVRGRSNFGAGTTVSNYDPIKDSKAGAIFILASCGANVSLSPYLTVLPGSLIATGSVDMTREFNVIAPNSLVIGARENGVVFEGYLDEVQRKISNGRSRQEVEYLVRSLKTKEALANFFAEGVKIEDVSQAIGFKRALEITEEAAKKLSGKTIPKYLELLKESIGALEQKISENPERADKYRKKINGQKMVIDESESTISTANEIYKRIEKTANALSMPESADPKFVPEKLTLTKGQETQLSTSLVSIGDL